MNEQTTLSLHEIITLDAADLVVFCLQRHLGSRPSKDFMERNFSGFDRRAVGFVREFTTAWTYQGLFDFVYTGEHSSMLDREVTDNFLLMVDSARFLQFASLEILGRPLDAGFASRYTNHEFDDLEVRKSVILAMRGALGKAAPQNGNHKNELATANHERWIEQSRFALGTALVRPVNFDKPLTKGLVKVGAAYPLLWRGDGDTQYAAFGMSVLSEVKDGSWIVKPEWVFHGPKSFLASGHYKVNVNLEGQHGDLFVFDVVTSGGVKKLHETKFFGSLQAAFHIYFEENAIDFEVRLFNLTGREVRMSVFDVSVSPIDV